MHTEFEKGMLVRDPNVTWYGPFPCPGCSKQIVKTGNGAPLLTLDAEDHNHHYPNFRWLEHQCSPATVDPTEDSLKP